MEKMEAPPPEIQAMIEHLVKALGQVLEVVYRAGIAEGYARAREEQTKDAKADGGRFQDSD